MAGNVPLSPRCNCKSKRDWSAHDKVACTVSYYSPTTPTPESPLCILYHLRRMTLPSQQAQMWTCPNQRLVRARRAEKNLNNPLECRRPHFHISESTLVSFLSSLLLPGIRRNRQHRGVADFSATGCAVHTPTPSPRGHTAWRLVRVSREV